MGSKKEFLPASKSCRVAIEEEKKVGRVQLGISRHMRVWSLAR